MTEITNYFPDPAGVFATDAHRRVLSHLPRPDAAQLNAELELDPPEPTGYTLLQLLERLAPDPDTPFRYGIIAGELVDDSPALLAVVEELVADGLIAFDAEEQEISDRRQPDEEVEPEVITTYRQTTAGAEKLQAPIANEPPPLEGAKLEAAKAHDAQLAEQEARDLVEARERRIEILRGELEGAEAELEESKS